MVGTPNSIVILRRRRTGESRYPVVPRPLANGAEPFHSVAALLAEAVKRRRNVSLSRAGRLAAVQPRAWPGAKPARKRFPGVSIGPGKKRTTAGVDKIGVKSQETKAP
jgi:hypothetical protein